MPYLLEVSGSVSSSVDISTVSSGSVVLSYDVPGRIDEDYDEWTVRYNVSGSPGLNSVVDSGSFSTSTVVSLSEVTSSYFVLELENSKTIEIPQTHPHLYYYKTSEDKWIWVDNHPQHTIAAGDYLFGSDGNPVKITTATYMGNDVLKSFVIVDVEEIDNAFYGNSSDGYGVLKHNGNRGGGGNAPPEHVGCGHESEDSVDVTWDAASPEAPNEKYNVRHATNSAMNQNLVTITGAVACDGSSDYTFTVGSLNSNTTYYFQVQQGGSTPSEWTPAPPVSCTTTGGAPDAPSTPGISQKDEDSITFTFSSTGATSYNLYFGTNNPPTNEDNGTNQAGTSKQYTGLSNATTYHFRVTATNSSGTSGYSTVQTTTTNTLAGGTPVLSSVTPISQTVSWTNPSGTYVTLLYGGTSASPTTLLTSGTTLSSYNHTGLTPGTTYYYRTRTQTYYHDGFYSDYSSVTSGAAASLSAPTNLAYTADSTEQITITWTNPTYSDRTYIEYNFGGGWKPVKTDGELYVTGENWTCSADDQWYLIYVGYFNFVMTANTRYQFKFRTYYDGNYGDWTSTFSTYTLPGPVTGLTATADSSDEITANWTNPAGGAQLETFYVEWGEDTNYSTGNYTSSINATSYQIDDGLNQSTNYDIRVTTKTDAGDDPTMATTDATTLSGPNPEAGDDLEMKYLGVMTGDASEGAEISMGTANGGATTEVSFKDFFAGSMSSIGGNPNMSQNQTRTFTANFDNAGTAFNSQIDDANFSWTKQNNNVDLVSTSGRSCNILATGAELSQCIVTCTLTPSFNDHITGADLSKSITITIVTS